MTWRPDLIDGPLTIPVMEGPLDEYGNPTQSGTVPGYHLNAAPIVTAEEGYDLADYDVVPDPSTPYRRFSGADTRFLKFADEAEAKAVLAAYWVDTE